MTSQNSVSSVANLDSFGDAGMSLGTSLDDLDTEDVTLVAFVLDMSSSMGPFTKDVVDAFRAEITALRLASTASSLLVSVTTFADQSQLLHGYEKVDRVPMLDGVYAPGGCTVLYDSVMSVLTRQEAYRKNLRDNGVRTKAIVVVLSDGGDNASRATAGEVRLEAERLRREESTTLAYVGFGNGDLAAIAAAIGFPTVLTAAQTSKEIRRVLGVVSASILRASRGTVSSKGFF